MLKCSDVATLTQIYQLKMMKWGNHPDTTHNSCVNALKKFILPDSFSKRCVCLCKYIQKPQYALSVIIGIVSKEKSMKYSPLNTKINLCMLGFVSMFTEYLGY